MLDLVPYMLALPVMSSLSHSLRAMCLLAMVPAFAPLQAPTGVKY
ncbi:hypothetical protein PC116_g26253 [Phytophthora cactorum]|nr:hypothetical protein PC116_g26253 [Phytophthora cactorum]